RRAAGLRHEPAGPGGRQGAADPGDPQRRAQRRPGDRRPRRDPPHDAHRAPGDHRAPAPPPRHRRGCRGQRARRARRARRAHLLPPGERARGRHGPGTLARAELRLPAPGLDRVRERAGRHALHDPASGARKDGGMTNPVWIIDDDRSIRWVFEKALAREGIAHRTFGAAQEALDSLSEEAPQVVVSDIRMPGTSGLEFMQQLKARLPATPVIIMTAHSDLESAVAAFQGGAFEYLPKPFDVDHAVGLVRRAMDESLRQAEPPPPPDEAPEILGQAPAMQEVFRAIGRLAQSHATVLITGESGTGKELVARALHRHSPRAAKAFIAINTAAIPKDLLESELFGHERGAFTGAQAMRRGRFEQAEGGTF